MEDRPRRRLSAKETTKPRNHETKRTGVTLPEVVQEAAESLTEIPFFYNLDPFASPRMPSQSPMSRTDISTSRTSHHCTAGTRKAKKNRGPTSHRKRVLVFSSRPVANRYPIRSRSPAPVQSHGSARGCAILDRWIACGNCG